MKKLAIVFALAFTFTTGMAVVTVITHTDQATAAGFDGRCADLDAC